MIGVVVVGNFYLFELKNLLVDLIFPCFHVGSQNILALLRSILQPSPKVLYIQFLSRKAPPNFWRTSGFEYRRINKIRQFSQLVEFGITKINFYIFRKNLTIIVFLFVDSPRKKSRSTHTRMYLI